MDRIKNKTIFISALDWGLGHATRCVPLIKQLMQDNVVILGVTPITALIFNEEFPSLKKVNVEPYNIRYSHTTPLSVRLLLDASRIFGVVKKEKLQLHQKSPIKFIIISLNNLMRFGFPILKKITRA